MLGHLGGNRQSEEEVVYRCMICCEHDEMDGNPGPLCIVLNVSQRPHQAQLTYWHTCHDLALVRAFRVILV